MPGTMFLCFSVFTFPPTPYIIGDFVVYFSTDDRLVHHPALYASQLSLPFHSRQVNQLDHGVFLLLASYPTCTLVSSSSCCWVHFRGERGTPILWVNIPISHFLLLILSDGGTHDHQTLGSN